MNSIKVGHVIFLAGGTIALYLLLRRLTHPSPASSSPVGCGSRPENPGPSQSRRQTKGVRLCQVYPSPESATATDVDIIAIHGLDTKSPDTWTWESKGARVNWLEHSQMLPKRLPTARIFTCDWPADLLEQPDFIQKTIEEFARLLLAGIKSRSSVANDGSAKDDRPIVFIASCLGGVVLMKALVMASHEYLSVIRATRGIVFLATPFRGTAFQNVANWAERCLRAWASIQDKNVSKLFEYVKPTFKLEELVRSFTTLCLENDLIKRVFTFYETGKSSLPRKIVRRLPDSLSQEEPLVDRRSATLDFVPHPLPLDRSHVRMNKFYGPDDPGYISVAVMVETLLCEVRNGQPVEKADVWVRNERYSLKNLEIERLSGDRLPMDRCYINLAIVKQANDKANRSRERDTTAQSSPFSLFARLKVETPETEVGITLPDLFEPRKTHDGQTRPSRILIRGRAGVGKSTLCKKIVYEFTYGTLWRGLFDRVLWVPLRNLKLEERRWIAGYNFKDLFLHEYFSQHPAGDKLAEALWGALKDTKSGRTLFILDGLDEVSQDLGHDRFRFLEELLNQSNVVITSRPNAILPANLNAFHLELETIGFYPDQVMDYIGNAFTDLETRNQDLGKIKEVQSFLYRHQLIQGLVRIPIQLDAFCYTWGSLREEDGLETMTAVYKNIEQSLWKKDAINLEKRTQLKIQVARYSEIKKSLKDELYLLEVLAFTGMYNDVINFEPKHRDTISEHFNTSDMDLLLDDMLGRISFLRTSDSLSKDRNYHFLHLTFQEYFGARYFVRQWEAQQPLMCLLLGDGKCKKVNPAEFLGTYKYNARYDIFWRFAAGLLDTKGEDMIRFFQAVEKEPRDLLGPTHQRLVIHCLSEVSMEMPLRKNLEDRITRWLLFECKFTSESRLAGETELPLKVLENAFQQGSKETHAMLILSLGKKVLSEGLLQAVAARLEDEAWYVRSAAVEVLKSQPALSERLLQALAVRLEHGDWDVRSAAVEVLKSQPALSERLLQAVAARLEHKDWDIRDAAVEVLQSQPALSEGLLQAVAARLENEAWYVRGAAIEVLQSQPALPEGLFQAVAGQLEHKYEYVRCAAVNTLKSQPTLPERLLQAVATRLEDEAWYVRHAAVNTLKSQPALSEGLLQAIAARLEDEDRDIRGAAVEVLKSQPTLSEGLFQAVAARLEDEDRDVRNTAIEVLKGQPTLPERVLQAVAAWLENKDEYIRRAAVNTLKSQPALSKRLLQAIAARLEHKYEYVRSAAVEVLKSQPTLSEKLLQAVIVRLEDEDEYVRSTAVEVLKGQPTLLEGLLQAVAIRLENKNWYVRGAAVEVFKDQLALSEKLLQAIMARLKDEDEYVRGAAIEVFKGQPTLSEGLLQAVVARLEDEDWYVRSAAVEVLKGQPALSEGLLQAVAARLEHEDEYVRGTAVNTLKSQPTLPEKLLQAVATRLEDEAWYVRYAAVNTLKSQPALSEGLLQAIAVRLEDEDRDVRGAVVNMLKSQPTLSEELLQAVAARLEDEDRDIRSAVVNMLKSQPTLSEGLLQAVAARLENEDRDVRGTAVEVLKSQPTLPEKFLQAIAAWLEDEDRDIRSAVVNTLKSQPTLSEELLQAVVARLEDEDRDVRSAAVEVLKSQPALSEGLLQAIAARLEDEAWYVRGAAVKVLKSQPALSEGLFQAIAARLENKAWYVRSAAVEVLKGQPTLSEGLLQAVAARLEDEDWDARGAAVEVLKGQPALSEGLLQAIAARLENEAWYVRSAAVEVLKGQPALSEGLLQAIAARLEDEDRDIRSTAVEVLKSQPTLSEGLFQAVAARLEDEDRDVRGAAVEVLKGQPALSEGLLQAIAARLEDEDWDVRGAAVETLLKQSDLSLITNHHVQSLHRILLKRSFDEHLSCHVMDNFFYVALGFKECRIGWQDRFTDAIQEAHKDLGIPSC